MVCPSKQQRTVSWQIRPFTPPDQPAARQIVLDGLGGHFGFIDKSLNPDLNDIWQYYSAPGNFFVVVEICGQLVGTGALIREEGSHGRLVRMSVSKSRQRQGIGRALVQHLIQKAKEQGYKRLLVETNNDWYDAIGLYQHCGFREYARDDESVYLQLGMKDEG